MTPVPSGTKPTTLLSAAGRSFLRAFIASIIVLIPGLLAAPNLSAAASVGWAATIASIVAGLKAIQVFVPQLAIGPWITKLVGAGNARLEAIEDSFVRAFVGTFITLTFGVLAAHTFTEARSLAIAAVVAAATAGVRAIQGALTKGDFPLPASGA